MADVDGLWKVVFGEEILFERKYETESVEGTTHSFDAPFFPSPEVRRDIMYGLDALLVYPCFDLEVEARIVDTDDCVGLVLQDVVFAEADVAQYGAQMHDHFDKTHDGEVANVTYRSATYLSHGVAAPEAELRLRVAFEKCFHQIGSMKVARGFAGYDIVLHFIAR